MAATATCPTCGRPKAAVYARISDDQRGERLGVTDQIDMCWSRVTDEGWCTCTPDADTFSDNDISAYKRKRRRDGYEALLEALRASRYPYLVTRDDGRLYRHWRTALEFYDVVTEHDIQIVTLWTARWDLSTADGRKRFRDSASDAQYEAERTGERVARARLRDAKLGKPSPGGQRAWGFMPDRVTHHHDHDGGPCSPERCEAEQVRDIARRLLAGESLRSASLRCGKNPKDVRRALLAPRMNGERVHGGVHYPAVWEPVLDRGTWEGVRALLSARNRDKVAGVVARKYLLTGFVYCGVEGCRSRAQGFRVGKYLKYACHPAGHVVRSVPRLDAHVRDWLLERAEIPTARRTVDPALSSAVQGFEARLVEAKELWKSGVLSPEEYAADKLDLEERRREAEARLAQATTDWDFGSTSWWAEDEETGEVLEHLHGRAAVSRLWWESADLRQQRVLLARYVSRILLHPNTNRRVFEPESAEIVPRPKGAVA